MAGQYSPIQFFRKVSNKYLIDYFEKKNIHLDIDLYAVEENDGKTIFTAFKKLDEITRHNIESDFQRVHAMANEIGVIALLEEATLLDNFNFIDMFKIRLHSFHDKAMFAYLDSPEYWQAASLIFQAKRLTASSWRTINNLPKFQKTFTDIDIKLLSKAIGEYFFDKEGRGKRCKIEHYNRGKMDFFYAFPEDFAKSEVEWIKDTLQDLPHTMAFEIIFVYCQEKDTLSIYARKNAKNILKLQQLFALHILKQQLTTFTPMVENKVYDLEFLVEKDFNFVIAEDSDIYSIKILQATATVRLNPKEKITVTSCPDKNINAVHERLAKLNLEGVYISQVVLKAVLKPSKGKELRFKQFSITAPDKCNLSMFGEDLLIRNVLKASGIEPQSTNLSLPWL
ncbi:hypothetical protein [Colwellia piezophila]|uniref:hypothetical protein n=1 Tax=Colwellia piezophila TaxID=211668 RepID=UPI00037F0326|nr:hypothetical protein [Colwellia piezophila]